VHPNGQTFVGHCNPAQCCPYDQIVQVQQGTCKPIEDLSSLTCAITVRNVAAM
jgi:hypothetical protein